MSASEMPPPARADDIVTKPVSQSVADTVAALIALIKERQLTLFAVIDQSAEAQRVGLTLRDMTLVIFGSPAAGTPVMQESPLAGLDLPLKVLVWTDGAQTNVSYYSVAALAARHGLEPALAANLAGIDPLTDALAASTSAR